MFQESTCDSADRELLRQRAQRTLQAARRGSVASALRYFQNPPIMDKHGRLDIALASEYQKEGPIMLEQATASGSSTAAAELFQLLRSGSYATEHFVLQVPVDPVRAVAVGRVLVCCGDPWISRVLRDAVFSMEARLSVSERARAALLEEGFKKAKFTENTEPQDALSEMQSCML